MMNGDHLGEEIELYALGMLEDDERLRIDAHAGRCRECAARLGRAEATVAHMVEATVSAGSAPQALVARLPPAAHERRWPTPTVSRRKNRRFPALWVAAAVAAAFTLVTASFAQQNAQLRSGLADDGAVFHAMIDSHFSHAQFASPDGLPLAAKIVYERHGGWYEVLAHGIDPRSRIIVVRGAVSTEFAGSFTRRDDVLTLALPALGSVSELRLVDARGRTIGQVRPALPVRGKVAPEVR